MSVTISCRDIHHTLLEEPLFEGVTVHVNRQERLGVLGANGSGKTTLLKILAGIVSPDRGERIVTKGIRLGYVPQDPSFVETRNVEQDLLTHGREQSHDLPIGEADLHATVGKVMSLLGFDDGSVTTGKLSGGWKKRLAIGRALLTEPDVLLLDEPTNHLDLEGIAWLEKLLLGTPRTVVVVTHDRAFLENVATRVVEVNRRYPDGVLSIEGPYSRFVEKRQEVLAGQLKSEASLASKVRREVEWLRQGPKARTSKSRGRLEEAQRLIEGLAQMRQRRKQGGTTIDFSATGRKTKRLLVAHEVSKGFGGPPLFNDLDLLLKPKMSLGLLGDNGSGKTTLLRLLAKELEPDQGHVRWAEDLKVVYFEQGRESLDPEEPLRYALSERGERVIYRGESLHVVSWARRFRFTPQQLDLPVGRLSGGEQAKLLIAQLMLRPADILLLDEPTNDLDIPTLEVLEESLLAFPGAVVMVTHDRYFMDRVCDLVVGFDGAGSATFYGDYSQWHRDVKKFQKEAKGAGGGRRKRKKIKKPLTYAEEKEYEGMEDRILEAEAHLEELRLAMEDPQVATNADELKKRYEACQSMERQVAKLYERWSHLEEKLARGSQELQV